MRKPRQTFRKGVLPFEDLAKHPAAERKHYRFDEGLKAVFPHEHSRTRRAQLYREFMRYAIRHDDAVNLHKPIETIPEPSVADVTSRIEEDRRTGFSEAMLADIQEWRQAELSRKRSASGKKGGLASVHKRLRKKV